MKIHSFSDIITNSSTEIFVVTNTSMEEIREAIRTSNTPCNSCPFKNADGGYVEGIDIEDIDGNDLSYYEPSDNVHEGDVIIKVRNWYTGDEDICSKLEQFLGDKIVLRDRW